MGGASLYVYLSLLCVMFVAVLFGIGWVLSIIGRRQERMARERHQLAKAERAAAEAARMAETKGDAP